MRMDKRIRCAYFLLITVFAISLQGCFRTFAESNFSDVSPDAPLFHGKKAYSSSFNEQKYVSRLPQTYPTDGEKVVVVNPATHAWGAYDESGNLVRGGIATGGADFCADENKPCRTDVGTFRIYRIGGVDCVSKSYPVGEGGALMPYCMFFNGGEALHGSPDQIMVDANISHGCIHMRIPAAAWLHSQFASIGTKVIILPY